MCIFFSGLFSYRFLPPSRLSDTTWDVSFFVLDTHLQHLSIQPRLSTATWDDLFFFWVLFISFKSAIYSEVEKCGKQKSAKAEEWLKSGRRVPRLKSD